MSLSCRNCLFSLAPWWFAVLFLSLLSLLPGPTSRSYAQLSDLIPCTVMIRSNWNLVPSLAMCTQSDNQTRRPSQLTAALASISLLNESLSALFQLKFGNFSWKVLRRCEGFVSKTKFEAAGFLVLRIYTVLNLILIIVSYSVEYRARKQLYFCFVSWERKIEGRFELCSRVASTKIRRKISDWVRWTLISVLKIVIKQFLKSEEDLKNAFLFCKECVNAVVNTL